MAQVWRREWVLGQVWVNQKTTLVGQVRHAGGLAKGKGWYWGWRRVIIK